VSGATRTVQLEDVLAVERRAIDLALARLRGSTIDSAPAGVAAAVAYALDAKGKRLRPILCVAAYRALRGGGGSDAIYDVAAAIELVHTYSLVHDDLPCMDDDDLRRGRPTTHRVFGARAALVAGAAMIPHAFAALDRAGIRLGLGHEARARLAGALARGAGGGGMVGGQWLDLQAEARPVDADLLEGIHRCKTGALFEASLRMGGIAAGAEPEAVDALAGFGRALGLAFQIADDLLDVTGDSAVLGKTAGRDGALAKATFPALLGVAEARARAELAAAQAVSALDRGGIGDALLRALARFAIERNR
jgi:geranylgeranyl pyrophosphate synthase